MSSTNRWYKRHKTDYYVTPHRAIEQFLSAWMEDLMEENEYLGDRPDRHLRLDPCAWGVEWKNDWMFDNLDTSAEMSYPYVIKKCLWIEVDTMDIREDSEAAIKWVDFTDRDLILWEWGIWEYDVIITNPPFSSALEIINVALDCVAPWWYVVMLLRLNFFWSKWRFEFRCNNMAKYCYIHHKRMSFTSDWATDSIEYAHFVWKKWENPKFCKTCVI